MKIAKYFIGLLVAVCAQTSTAQSTLSADFSPNTIGPGSQSTLVFTLTNSAAFPNLSLQFTSSLPADVTIGEGAYQTNCYGNVTAPTGGSTISLMNGRLGGQSECDIRIPVTSSTIGSHTLAGTTLSGSAGSSMSVPTDLTVDSSRPGVSLLATPNNLAFGATTTLTVTIDNSANAAAHTALTFEVLLPQGVDFASNPNFTTDCRTAAVAPTVTLENQTLSYNYSGNATFPAVAANSTCNVTFDAKIATHPEVLISTSDVLADFSISSGYATELINVASSSINLTSRLTPAIVRPNEQATLTYTLTNTNRQFSASNISFSTDLDAALTGLTATGLPLNDNCGVGSSLSGTAILSATGLSLAPGTSCSFDVPLLVPAGAVAGNYPLIHSDPAGTINSAPVIGNASAQGLSIANSLQVSKDFLESVAGAGNDISLEFTLTNTDPANAATNITVTEIIPPELATAVTVPLDGSCNGTGTFAFQPHSNFNPARFLVSDASLSGGTSCTFTLVLNISADAASSLAVESGTDLATYTLDSEDELKAQVSSDTLEIVGAIEATLSANTLLAQPGSLIDFTLALGAGAGSELIDQDLYPAYTNLGFNLDLNSVIPGLSAIGTPIAGCNSTLTGTTVVNLSGGSLASGESCELTFSTHVPVDTVYGIYPLTGPLVSSSHMGETIQKTLNSLSIEVAGLTIETSFSTQPAEPGDIVDMFFTLTNTSSEHDVTLASLNFRPNQLINSMAATSLTTTPLTPCGPGSQIIGNTSNFTLNDASIAIGDSCTFSLSLEVPAGTASGTYQHIVDNITYTIDGATDVSRDHPVSFNVLASGDIADESDVDAGQVLGVDPIIEGTLGDVNGDTIDDALQDHVASIINPVTGLPASLVFDPACTLASFTMVDASTLGTDGPRTFPDGIARFELQGCSSSNMELHLPGGSMGNATQIRKFGVETPNSVVALHWFDFAGTIDATNEMMSWSLTDNAAGDQSISANIIIDPIGPAIDPDPDGDGIDSTIEQPLGDVNNDGTDDYLQAGVASIVSSVTGKPVALVFDDSNCTLDSFEIIDAASLPANGEHRYPDGLASFELVCETSPIEIHWQGGNLAQGYSVHKYGPQSPNYGAGNVWYELTSATLNTGASMISFTLTDDTLGDSTGDDGRLVDPVGVASTTGAGAGLPVNSPLAVLAALLSLLGTGAWLYRRRALST
ncbi:hypothetical protein KO507_17435 [Gilvimarinus agarilyticus]|uniref:DUF7933 domain-containing protein n=1 Tax=Gilvimarinus sp. 2_MG-2023 TaxID=3062666 RepID=UPI001C088667|nr:choice-of-anchor U domain-containing protein [Gilvimarinus sp. 2_MG-2023]MBU2887551.1 hypothetical protein [Gilvimarinus agarilyticus]MDO6572202.1 choice-of-anchor U domain-containing protein [Gilvimarinus sp. 2_MG-2023]